jgi:protein-S-isoprenylcysteine O-methyltransferase Ste14
MELGEIKEWFSFLQEAPENIREYLLGTFWMFVFLVLVWLILKLLSTKEFKNLYKILGVSAKNLGSVSQKVAESARDGLELPEPYPRVKKVFSIFFMLNSYAGSFLFASFFLVFAGLLSTSDTPSFLQRMGGMLFALVLAYGAWFLFAQAEQDRVKLFKKAANKQINKD